MVVHLCLEPGFLTWVLADRWHSFAPVDRDAVRQEARAIFCLGDSRWLNGAADG